VGFRGGVRAICSSSTKRSIGSGMVEVLGYARMSTDDHKFDAIRIFGDVISGMRLNDPAARLRSTR
jgi:hypothetical protein